MKYNFRYKIILVRKPCWKMEIIKIIKIITYKTILNRKKIKLLSNKLIKK
jgi:hypothetical protein